MATAPKTATAAAAKAPAKTAAKAAPKAAAAGAGPGDTPAAAREKPPTLKIRDLVSRVEQLRGGKRRDLKEIIETTLTVMGEALSKGEDLNLPGLGRTRVARTAEKDGASMMTLKVKRGPHRPKAEKEPLADDEDDS